MADQRKSIKEWAEDERPREKMLKKGIASLSNAELIAILFGTGIKNESAVELARKLLDSTQNNLNNLARLNVNEIKRIKGIGEAKAITLLTALELGRRRKTSEIEERKRITSSQDVYDFFGAQLGDLPYEEFWIILLNRSNTIIDKLRISQGGIAGTVTDVRIILKHALDRMACGIILCHNHPSGSQRPSEADNEITHKIKQAGRIMDINLLDHIIVTTSGYYSYADDGTL